MALFENIPKRKKEKKKENANQTEQVDEREIQKTHTQKKERIQIKFK